MTLIYHKEYYFLHMPSRYVNRLYRYKNPKTNHLIYVLILIYGRIVVRAVQNGFRIILRKRAYHLFPTILLSFLIHYHQYHFEPYPNGQVYALDRSNK